MISEDDISLMTDLIKLLNWKNILYFLIFSILICMSVIGGEYLFDHGRYIPMVGDHVKLLSVNRDIRNRIHEFIMKKDSVAEVQILTLNFQRNIKIQTHIDIKNPELQKIYDRYKSNELFNEFIFNQSHVSNDEFLQLTRGEFVCIPYKESSDYIREPDVAKYVTDICSIGIPPYDSTLGVMVVYFQFKPPEDEQQKIYLFMRDISIQIYNDIK